MWYFYFLFASLFISLAGSTEEDFPTQEFDNITNAILKPGLRKGRWGIFFSYEPVCTKACVQNGKWGGRMFGGICRCYCARNEEQPCLGTYPSCTRLCKLNFYPLGGDCVDGKVCFCNCSVRQAQTPNSSLPTTTLPPCVAPPFEQTPAPAPSPGTLGIQGQRILYDGYDEDYAHG